MASHKEKSRITEIQVRMDCNGCVQKIKKALHGISGIYELYIDLPQQKITIVGWADPEKIAKAIKKTRKSAIICSHTEPPDQPADDEPPEPTPEQRGVPPSDPSGTPPQPQTAQPPGEAELPKERPSSPSLPPPPSPDQVKQSLPDHNQTVAEPSAAAAGGGHQQQQHQGQPGKSTKATDVEQVHVIHHYPPEYGYGYDHGYRDSNSSSHSYAAAGFFRPDPPTQPLYATTHSYNTYRPSNVVTRYEYIRPDHHQQTSARPPMMPYAATHHEYIKTEQNPPLFSSHAYYNTNRPSPYITQYADYNRPMGYNEEFNYFYNNGDNYYNSGNMGSVFSDENPNACTIV